MTRFLLLALLAVGCSDARVGEQQAAILGGRVASGDPLVGMLEFQSGRFGTGTLVGPRLVLTAAHVVGGNIQGFYTGTGLPSGQLDNTVSSPTMTKHEIGDKHTHPSYQCTPECEPFGGVDLDVGVVELKTPMVEAPFPLDSTLPAVGDTCRVVGFGLHESEVPDAAGDEDMATVKQKREADVRVVSIDDTYILVEWITGISDHGDSGGPLFCGSKLVGTTVMHTDGELFDHKQEYYARVDRALPWINEQIAATAPPDMASSADLSTPPADEGGCAFGRSRDVGPVGLGLVALVLLWISARRRRA